MKKINLLPIMLLFMTACNSDSSSGQETKGTTNNSPGVSKVQKPDSLTQVYNLGKKLYDNTCLQCHQTSEERTVGPGLKGIFERRSVDWVTRWTRNSQKVIASGDPYAVKLFNEYNKTVMQSFNYDNSDMQALLFYIANVNRGNQPYLSLD
ncbi:cytochrome c [uncultured Microscilla sp.]|uniref:c-type cytochrome n=1 Tax=uncultured Microscilla sp. TaxID=432653 RepID=UPI00261EA1BC|nr:cytochrome c [uncultured Microscilla sp.]